MFIRNIITTSALVVLLGLAGGSAYANDLGDRDSHTPGSAPHAFAYDADAYKAAFNAGVEFAATVSSDATAEFESDPFIEIPVTDK